MFFFVGGGTPFKKTRGGFTVYIFFDSHLESTNGQLGVWDGGGVDS